MSPINGDTNGCKPDGTPYTQEEIVSGAELKNFLESLKPAPRLRRITPANKGETPPALVVPKTPIPPRKRYITDPGLRPTVQYTDPIYPVPKNPFRAKYIQENIRLRVELEAANREREARSAFHRAKQIVEVRASFREGVAAGYLKGAEAQLRALRDYPIGQKILPNFPPGKQEKTKTHNQRGYEQRVAKRARRQQDAESKI